MLISGIAALSSGVAEYQGGESSSDVSAVSSSLLPIDRSTPTGRPLFSLERGSRRPLAYKAQGWPSLGQSNLILPCPNPSPGVSVSKNVLVNIRLMSPIVHQRRLAPRAPNLACPIRFAQRKS